MSDTTVSIMIAVSVLAGFIAGWCGGWLAGRRAGLDMRRPVEFVQVAEDR